MARGLDCSGLSWTQGTGAFLPRQRFRSCSPPRPLLCADCADSIVSTATDLPVANPLSPSIRSDGHLPHNWRSCVARKNSSPTRHQNCPFLWHFGVSTIRKNKAGKGFNCVDDRIHTVEVIGSNPIAPTIFHRRGALRVWSRLFFRRFRLCRFTFYSGLAPWAAFLRRSSTPLRAGFRGPMTSIPLFTRPMATDSVFSRCGE